MSELDETEQVGIELQGGLALNEDLLLLLLLLQLNPKLSASIGGGRVEKRSLIKVCFIDWRLDQWVHCLLLCSENF